jgi:threonylcarbamoyladenosine tRNA methylthiotransferase MtaB
MHVFKYSPRKGTPAAAFKEQVAPSVKEERSKRLIELSDKNVTKFNENYIGRVMPVLFEQETDNDEGLIEGLTSNYIRVVCKGSRDLKGSIRDVKLIGLRDDFILGEINDNTL